MDTVMILGTEYTIRRNVPPSELGEGLGGYCDPDLREIRIVDFRSLSDEWSNESQEKIQARERETLRHEIVHAFFNESGLRDSTSQVYTPWSQNEEMVDWFAIQGQKIYKAWMEVGCID